MPSSLRRKIWNSPRWSSAWVNLLGKNFKLPWSLASKEKMIKYFVYLPSIMIYVWEETNKWKNMRSEARRRTKKASSERLKRVLMNLSFAISHWTFVFFRSPRDGRVDERNQTRSSHPTGPSLECLTSKIVKSRSSVLRSVWQRDRDRIELGKQSERRRRKRRRRRRRKGEQSEREGENAFVSADCFETKQLLSLTIISSDTC